MADSRKGGRMNPLYELTLSRMREFWREPEAVFWVFVFPVILALALGIAFRNRPPEKIPVTVDQSLADSAVIVKTLSASSELEVRQQPFETARKALRLGEIEMIVAPPDEGEGESSSAYKFIFDPTRPTSRLARLIVDEVLQKGMGREDAVTISDEVFAESGARYIDFLIPGLIGLNLMASGLWGVGFNVVFARSRKLLKLFTATPMRKSHFLLSFMLSRLLFLVLEVAALVGFGWAVFGVKVHGSILSLAIVLLTGALTFAGMGMLVASRARSIEAVSGWMNLVMLPMWLLSGSFFSYSRFPEVIIPFIKILPLTALNDALRAIMNSGASLAGTWFELAVLALWGSLSFAVAVKIFRWQ